MILSLLFSISLTLSTWFLWRTGFLDVHLKWNGNRSEVQKRPLRIHTSRIFRIFEEFSVCAPHVNSAEIRGNTAWKYFFNPRAWITRVRESHPWPERWALVFAFALELQSPIRASWSCCRCLLFCYLHYTSLKRTLWRRRMKFTRLKLKYRLHAYISCFKHQKCGCRCNLCYMLYAICKLPVAQSPADPESWEPIACSLNWIILN